MVCLSCEKKLTKLATPELWKAGSNAKDRPLNENKLLASAKLKSFAQYQARCRLCNAQVTQRHGTYCQGCAFKHGICSMCGIKLHDISLHRQTNI